MTWDSEPPLGLGKHLSASRAKLCPIACFPPPPLPSPTRPWVIPGCVPGLPASLLLPTY